jgi:hypothetical protein
MQDDNDEINEANFLSTVKFMIFFKISTVILVFAFPEIASLLLPVFVRCR